jgi:hypothetical protein
MLAPGEHVLTAGEVDAIGGQAAMFRLRDAIRSGTVPRYAAGGTIPRPTPAPSAADPRAVGSSSGTCTSTLVSSSGRCAVK